MIKSSRIDRKTILLAHMQMYDNAAQAATFDGISMETKQEKLIKKLGAVKIKNLLKEYSVSSHDSLDCG